MTRAVDMANLLIAGEVLGSNEDIFEGDLTVDANTNKIVAGPVTIPNVTINGNLSSIGNLTVTTTLTIASAGKLFIK
tara:strand:- start:73 stop:303 length:231 start_codon:yes stop_codon:yes gene_type:complete